MKFWYGAIIFVSRNKTWYGAFNFIYIALINQLANQSTSLVDFQAQDTEVDGGNLETKNLGSLASGGG